MTARAHLSNEDLSELRQLTRIDDPEAAVVTPLNQYRRDARRLRPKVLSGKAEMADNWRALEDAELGESDPA